MKTAAVQRWEFFENDGLPETIGHHPDGMWVKYSDFEKISQIWEEHHNDNQNLYNELWEIFENGGLLK